MVEVVVTDEFAAWYEPLTLEEQESIERVVDRLVELGVALGFPYSSQIKGSPIGLRELRIQHQGRPYRVLYAFDPKRQAVLLVGGDKTGPGSFLRRVRASRRVDLEGVLARVVGGARRGDGAIDS